MKIKLFVWIVCLYGFWLVSQNILVEDVSVQSAVLDRIHESDLVKYILDHFESNLNHAAFHIGLTTALIDLSLVGVLIGSICRTNVKPIFLICTGIVCRQICQFITKLPIPDRMIWFDPGIPTVTMVYAVTNDFFFSGHTLTGMIVGFELMGSTYLILRLYGGVFLVYQIAFVLLLRIHYFMDVYAACSTYFMLCYFYEKYYVKV